MKRSSTEILQEIRTIKNDLKSLQSQIQIAVRKKDKVLGEKLLKEHEELGKKTMLLVQEMHNVVKEVSPQIPEDMKPFGQSILDQLNSLISKEEI